MELHIAMGHLSFELYGENVLEQTRKPKQLFFDISNLTDLKVTMNINIKIKTGFSRAK